MITSVSASTRATRTRARIIDAAQALLSKGESNACTMRAVAELAGVTPAAIYRHFANQEQLVAHTVDLALQRLDAQLVEAIISLPVGSFERLLALGRAYIRFAEENEQEFRVLFMPAGRGRRKLSAIFGRAGYPILRRCVAEAMELGRLRRGDPDRVALFLWSRVHGLVSLFLACDFTDELEFCALLDPLKYFDETHDLVRDGLAPSPHTAAAEKAPRH